MGKQPSHRSYVSDFQISIGGIMNTFGDLVGSKVTNAGKEERLQIVCPICDEAHSVQQFYRCTEDASHTDFTQADCMKARQDDDGNLVKLTKEQVSEAKKSELPEKHLDVRVHKIDEVRDFLVPDSNSYLFRPKNPKDPVYNVILAYLDSNPEYVLMGLTQYRGNEKCVTLRKGLNGHLYVQEVIWPEDLREFESPPDVEHDDKFDKAVQLANGLLSGAVEHFDVSEYKKESRKRIATLVTMVSAGQTKSEPKQGSGANIDDLIAVLEAAKNG